MKTSSLLNTEAAPKKYTLGYPGNYCATQRVGTNMVGRGLPSSSTLFEGYSGSPPFGANCHDATGLIVWSACSNMQFRNEHVLSLCALHQNAGSQKQRSDRKSRGRFGDNSLGNYWETVWGWTLDVCSLRNRIAFRNAIRMHRNEVRRKETK